MNHPTGTVTFLFTDIEGSTRLWERSPEAMRLALERHDSLLRQAIEAHRGYVFKTVGDAFCAAFSNAPDALAAALNAHLALAAEQWGETGPIRVRMGLHTGHAQLRDDDYFGLTVNRAARLQGIGHGQQTLISQTTFEFLPECPSGTSLTDLGMHRLKDLAAPEHVWQLNHPSLPEAFPPLKSLTPTSTNLPKQLTSFIGREKEMQEVQEHLGRTRLLTLTGSGGTGKTRLAIQAAAEVLEQYADGVWLVELASLSDPDLVPQTVAETLNIREAQGEPITRTLVSALKEKQILLVLDNCEHLLDASARLTDSLLKSCPKVKVMASSREALRITGESAYRVPSLSVPPLPLASDRFTEGTKENMTPERLLDYESVRLFTERAVTVRSDFEVTSQNAAVLASVCHRLDGIPLAIELASARVRAMPLEQIETRLDSRFRLLTGGSRTALPRQQTLRALIDWSYDLLGDEEKTLLAQLSVFADGWNLEAVEAVFSGEGIEDWETMDLLASLVDKSLVCYEEREEKSRYRLLETVRQYARDRLMETGESEAVRTRHRDYFLEFAEMAGPKLSEADQGKWLKRLEEEHENLRAALEWSVQDTDAEAGLRLSGMLAVFWDTCGHITEGRDWYRRALENETNTDRTRYRAKALYGAGILAFAQGDYTTARDQYQAALEIWQELGDRSGAASSLNGLGNVAALLGDYPLAQTLFEESLAISRELGDKRLIAGSLNSRGNVAYTQGDFAAARADHQEALNLKREFGDRAGIAASLCNLADATSFQGDYVAACAAYEESMTLSREVGYRQGLANALNGLGSVAFQQGDFAAARSFYEDSLTTKRQLLDQSGIAVSLHNLGCVALRQHDMASAHRYFQESLAVFREIGYRLGIALSLSELGIIASALGEPILALTYHEECLALQRELGNRSGVAAALESLGQETAKQGDFDRARTSLEECLQICADIGNRNGIATTLGAFANLFRYTGAADRAVVLWSAAIALCEAIGSPLPPSTLVEYDREIAELRSALSEEEFATAWERGQAMPQATAVEYALEATCDP